MNVESNLTPGTENLLVNCARLKPDETLLIISEDPVLGWYDAQTPAAIATAAKQMGVVPTLLEVGKPENELDPAIEEAIGAHDCTIYLSRIGDQDRFGKLLPGKRSVMCYVRDIKMLESDYCRAPYSAFRAIKNAVDEILLGARRIDISCPLGTNISGRATGQARKEKADVSILRFPLGVPLPLDAARFSGRVALAHFLTPTGSKSYQPNSIALEDTTFVEVENGRIVGYEGDSDQVGKIKQHYDRVANQFGIDRDIVHSWHAGIHPGSAYPANAADNPDLWSNTVFTNPRLLHFHTCGNYAPAEICWMVLDHTIKVDGINLWDGGRLDLEAFPQTKIFLEQWPQLKSLFASPSQEVGLPQQTGSANIF